MKKNITYIAIFVMLLHFSIVGVHASEIEAPSVEEETIETERTSIDEEVESEESQPENELVDNENKEYPAEEESNSTDTQNSNEQLNSSEEIDPSSEKEVLEEKSTDSLVEEEEEKAEESKSEEIILFSNSTELPYKQGDNHEVIIPIKVKLNALGFDGIAETGNYGSWTAKRVSEFQKYYGLSVTGEVDHKTLDKLNEVSNSPYQNGQSNSYTTEIKIMLNALGYSGLAEGPVFGNLTETRVKEFQNDNSLKAHGIVDNPTISALETAYGDTEFQKGDNHSAVIQIKHKLNALGFSGLALTGNYGNLTETRVTEFQSYYGLSSTGIADQKTQVKLDEVYNSPYQNGKSNSYTTEIKTMLNALGYDGLALGPVFGNLTETRVKEFQSDYGLRDHGIADAPTINALENAYNKSEFKIGDDHPAVIQIKEKLNALGFAGLALSGNYGNLTETRVTEFQSYYGLSSTGIADQKTQEKLDEVYNSPYQNGKSNSYTNEIKTMLNALGYDGLALGPVFGNLTETRVKEFQSDYGLRDHGIADYPTINALEIVYNDSVFKIGDDDPAVIQIKQKLNTLGFAGLALTGNYGNLTETRVSQFQMYYGLSSTGIADKKTQEKLDEVYNSPYQNGKSNPYTVEIKKMLNALGYSGLAEGPVFGKLTETRVKEFQSDYGLRDHGIADELTIEKINEVYDDRIQITYSNYGLTLEQALNIQMNQLQQTDKYRNDPAYVHGSYVNVFNAISGSTVNVRESAKLNGKVYKSLKYGTEVIIKGEVTGDVVSGSTTWYQIEYDKKKLYVHSSLVDKFAETTVSVNIRQKATANSLSFDYVSKGTLLRIIDEGGTWHKISYGTWRNPTRADVKEFLNPNNNDIFQHLELDTSVGVTAAELNKVLKGKGILEGQGQAFINAGKRYSVNEIYLISHALLETGHGTSKLANGIQVGKNSNGNPVLVTASNKNSLTDIETTYNMFGIRAVDSDPDRQGAIHAYNKGWFTPNKAIVGGAQFIEDSYIHNEYKQNTLYKMRWNPANPGYPQYATDIQWATKQVSNIKNLYDLLDNPLLKFNIIQYS